jgi:hypothetical protein
MKKLLLILPLALCGCAAVHSTTWNDQGKRKSYVYAVTFFDAHSDLAKFRNATDTTTNGQFSAGTSIGSLNQTSQTTTNFNELVGTIVNAAVKGATGK